MQFAPPAPPRPGQAGDSVNASIYENLRDDLSVGTIAIAFTIG
ncbi:MAG TPA: hypothetical protein VKA85_01645 [Candidatus Limnocylindrales bacterium]|nr:hypothetical protein [Candidatus Limnocylindrales bacterium]